MNSILYFTYEVSSRLNLAINMVKVLNGYMKPEQMLYYMSEDEAIKQILFR